jgi:hypothetical protein
VTQGQSLGKKYIMLKNIWALGIFTSLVIASPAQSDKKGSDLLIEAKAQLAVDEFQALQLYLKVCESDPRSAECDESLKAQFIIAQEYLKGKQRLFMGLRIVDARDLGLEVMLRISENEINSELAAAALLEVGQFYILEKDFDKAAISLKLYLDTQPAAEKRKEVEAQLIDCLQKKTKGPGYDMSGVEEARKLIIEQASYGHRDQDQAKAEVAKLEESLALDQLKTAQWYARRDDLVSARYVILRLIKQWPKTKAAAQSVEFAKSRKINLEQPAKPSADQKSLLK